MKLSIITAMNIPVRSIPLECENKSLTLPGNVVKSLVSPSCDPKEVVLQLIENLHLDQTDLEQPTPENNENDPFFCSNSQGFKSD